RSTRSERSGLGISAAPQPPPSSPKPSSRSFDLRHLALLEEGAHSPALVALKNQSTVLDRPAAAQLLFEIAKPFEELAFRKSQLIDDGDFFASPALPLEPDDRLCRSQTVGLRRLWNLPVRQLTAPVGEASERVVEWRLGTQSGRLRRLHGWPAGCE